jgi:acetyl-CoA acetyltransferase
MSSSNKKFCIVGLGVTKVGDCEGRSSLMLECEAARLAMEDAGLEPRQINGAIQMQSDPGGGIRTRHDDSFARAMGIPANVYMENIGRGGELCIGAILIAEQLLNLGICDYVICSHGRDNWSRSRIRKKQGILGSHFMPKDGNWGSYFGESTPNFHGLLAQRHMHVFGTKSEQLAHIAVAQREWACLNPASVRYGQPITVEDHQSSPIISHPYHLYDVCVLSDGGTAFIITTEERAKDMKQKPIYVAGLGFGEQLRQLWWDNKNYEQLDVAVARDQSFGQAGITLDDIDIAELYDCFTMEVMMQIEGYGWCGKGEGGPFVATPGRLGPKGQIKHNTGGGLLSSHHLGNLTPMAEAVMQLRGQAGERQVKDAEVALVTGHGGEILSGQMCSIHSSMILTQ